MRRTTSLNDDWLFTCTRWETPPKKLGFASLEPRAAVVPGHVHLDLMHHGIIADPFVRCHELGCQWVDREHWIYSRQFEFEPDAAGPVQLLHFDALDTVCRVYLNDQLIAEHDNMFLPLEVDVTGSLSAGTNRLRVEFDPAEQVGEQRKAAYFQKNGIAEDTPRFGSSAFVRKAPYMFGWDFGPKLPSAGICGNVSLIEHAGRIVDVRIEQRHLADGSVEVRFSSEFEQAGASGEVPAVYHFVDGIDEPIFDGEWRTIESPRLWWPRGMGAANLYQVTSFLCVSVPRTRWDAEGAIDVRRARFGLRVVEVQRNSDDYGKSFQFVVNGKPIYALGANWIPDDSFPSRISEPRLRAQLERACDLSMNMLRVWGGGFYESEAFYDLCDELGILVWQDFPYACSYYPDDTASCDVARREAKAHVKRLRNRACLAIWCGNNENHVMREDGWDGKAQHPRRYEGQRIYEQVLPEVIAELDPLRPYIPSSPFGEGHPNSGRDGDQHYWDVWHGRGDYVHYRDSDARFCSEFGFASAPSHATWLAVDPSRTMLVESVRDPIARFHDKTAKGYETFIGFIERHYPVCHNLEAWTYYSQLNQRDALRFAIEHFRRSERCRGSLIWQLNDCWPVQSWSVIDSSGHYKAAAFELRRLYAPLLASIERLDGTVRVWGVLDNSPVAVTAEFVVELRRLSDGSLLSRQATESTLQPGERRPLLELSLHSIAVEDTIVVAQVEGRQSFLLLAEPKDLALTPEPIHVTAMPEHLIVTASQPILDLCLWDEEGKAMFLDNFATQVDYAKVRLRYRYLGLITKLFARSLAGSHPVVLKPGTP